MTLGIIMYSGIYLIAWIYPKLNINNSKSYYFYDKDSNLISGTDEYSGIDAISPYLKNATLSIEDRHFYTHGGFDYLRIGKAMFNNINQVKLLKVLLRLPNNTLKIYF